MRMHRRMRMHIYRQIYMRTDHIMNQMEYPLHILIKKGTTNLNNAQP